MERGFWNITAINYIYYIEFFFYCFFLNFPCYIKITHFKPFIHFLFFEHDWSCQTRENRLFSGNADSGAVVPAALFGEGCKQSIVIQSRVPPSHSHTSQFSHHWHHRQPHDVIAARHHTAHVMHTMHPNLVFPGGCVVTTCNPVV